MIRCSSWSLYVFAGGLARHKNSGLFLVKLSLGEVNLNRSQEIVDKSIRGLKLWGEYSFHACLPPAYSP